MSLGVMTDTEHNKEKMDVDSTAPMQTVIDLSKPDKPPLIEIKNGRVVLHQKALSFEKMSETMQEIVKFRDMLDKKQKEDSGPLQRIPEEYLPLIAKLTHESERTAPVLAKHILKALLPNELDPTQNVDSGKNADQQRSLPSSSVIESAIIAIAERINYGLDCIEKPASALCVWKWEVKEEKRNWLPVAMQGTISERISERIKAKSDLIAMYQALPEIEKQALLSGGRKDKSKEVENVNVTSNTIIPNGIENSNGTLSPSTEAANGSVRPKKEADPEKAAKEKERAEKRAAKAEKERKEMEAQNKSRNLLSAFLKKPQKSKPSGSNSATNSNGESSRSCSPEKGALKATTSEFEKVFKPFVVKKDASLAPINRFRRKVRDDVIVLDEVGNGEGNDAEKLSKPEELLKCAVQNSIFALPKSQRHRRIGKEKTLHFKTNSTYCVREILDQLNEAEVSGDTTAVRRYLNLLESRSAIPAKVLIFQEDTRPGYFGTFTRRSNIIGPRSPWGKDVVSVDYTYDSGEEWEEEEEGAEDVMSVDGNEEEEDTSLDSDMDDWLVDDEEVIDVDLAPPPIDLDDGFPDILMLPLPKRKAPAAAEKKESKKRKVITLVPFTKGPCWEEQIGICELDLLKPYRIQLFNDTPFPIDPFTFVAGDIHLEQTSSTNPKFAIPALPEHVVNTVVQATSPSISTTAPLIAPGQDSSMTRRKSAPMPPPKTTFPEQLLPNLIKKISQLETGNLMGIVESVFQEVKDMKVKKNAIEAKVKEVAEKCRFKKIWVVKEEFVRLAA